MLKVSCILTSYNRPTLIRESIASVLNQTYPEWELVIVDDNSNALTKDVLRAFEASHSRIRVIQSGVREEDRPKTARYATCINLAIPQLTGDLVTYLTDDDIYLPERFEKMVQVFEKRPEVHVLYGMQRLVHVNNGIKTVRGVRPLVGITRSPASQIDHNSVMHRYSCFKRVPRWNDDPSFWGWADAVFFSSLAVHWDFHPLPILTDEHRFHVHSVQSKFHRNEAMYKGTTE